MESKYPLLALLPHLFVGLCLSDMLYKKAKLELFSEPLHWVQKRHKYVISIKNSSSSRSLWRALRMVGGKVFCRKWPEHVTDLGWWFHLWLGYSSYAVGEVTIRRFLLPCRGNHGLEQHPDCNIIFNGWEWGLQPLAKGRLQTCLQVYMHTCTCTTVKLCM